MKDPRISIRLTDDEHQKLKIIAIKKKKSIQDIMIDYIHKLIKKEEKKLMQYHYLQMLELQKLT